MKKPAIPAVNVPDRALQQSLLAMTENIQIITGARTGTKKLATLASTATTADLITKMNEIITRLNYDGQ